MIHHVTVQNLTPDTVYYYQCGDSQAGMSQTYSFRMPPAVGANAQ